MTAADPSLRRLSYPLKPRPFSEPSDFYLLPLSAISTSGTGSVHNRHEMLRYSWAAVLKTNKQGQYDAVAASAPSAEWGCVRSWVYPGLRPQHPDEIAELLLSTPTFAPVELILHTHANHDSCDTQDRIV